MHRAARGDGLRRWAVTMARNRRRVYIGWLLVVCAGLLGLPHLLNSLASPAITVDGSESERAGKLLGAVVPTLGNEQLVVVLNSAAANPVGAELDSAVAAVVAELGARDIVSGAIPLPRAGDRTPALALPEFLEPVHALLRDEHTAYVLVGMSGDDRERQRQAPRIQAGLDRAVSERVGDAVHPYLVGVSVFGEAVQRAEISDLLRIDLVAIPLAALLLFLVLAAPAASAIPLAVAGASVVGTLGCFSLLVHAVPLDGMLIVGVNAIGLGIGIDYALFVVTRYRGGRDAGARGRDIDGDHRAYRSVFGRAVAAGLRKPVSGAVECLRASGVRHDRGRRRDLGRRADAASGTAGVGDSVARLATPLDAAFVGER